LASHFGRSLLRSIMYARGFVTHARGQHSLLDLARIHNVKEATIQGIVKGKTHLK
jgi:hypothetical protein